MSLNITTDYAIRIMMYLANYYDPDPLFAPDGSCSGKVIADKMNIPYNYFLKIVPRLKDAGYLISFQAAATCSPHHQKTSASLTSFT